MTVEIFAEWFRRQGLRVVQTKSSYWVEAGPRIFQAFPYHWLISPTQAELDNLLQTHSAVGLRYSTPWDQLEGAASYHVVFTGQEYSISVLPKKTRPDVRKVMEKASVEPISFARLANEGWRLREETLERQGRRNAESEAWWQRLCSSADGLPGFEAWATIYRWKTHCHFDCLFLSRLLQRTLPAEPDRIPAVECKQRSNLWVHYREIEAARKPVDILWFALARCPPQC